MRGDPTRRPPPQRDLLEATRKALRQVLEDRDQGKALDWVILEDLARRVGA